MPPQLMCHPLSCSAWRWRLQNKHLAFGAKSPDFALRIKQIFGFPSKSPGQEARTTCNPKSARVFWSFWLQNCLSVKHFIWTLKQEQNIHTWKAFLEIDPGYWADRKHICSVLSSCWLSKTFTSQPLQRYIFSPKLKERLQTGQIYRNLAQHN